MRGMGKINGIFGLKPSNYPRLISIFLSPKIDSSLGSSKQQEVLIKCRPCHYFKKSCRGLGDQSQYIEKKCPVEIAQSVDCPRPHLHPADLVAPAAGHGAGQDGLSPHHHRHVPNGPNKPWLEVFS